MKSVESVISYRLVLSFENNFFSLAFIFSLTAVLSNQNIMWATWVIKNTLGAVVIITQVKLILEM